MDQAPRPDDATPNDLYGCRVSVLDGARVEGSPCPVCGSAVARRRFSVETVEAPVIVCEECGSGRFDPMPSAEQVARFYPAHYYGEGGDSAAGVKFRAVIEAAVRWVGARHVEFLSRGLPSGSRILDVGCGRGVVLGALADRGFEVHGVEASAAAARGADARAEVRVAPRLADAGYPAAHFDQVLLWHVLEHLPEPRETLREVARILRPGGRVVVAVPNFASTQARWAGAAWFHLDLPRHLYQFPLAALRRLLDECGFESLSDHHFSLRQNPYGWVQSAQNRIDALPRNGLYTLLQNRDDVRPFALATRVALLGLGVLLAPIGLAASFWEAWRRDGATVHVVALRRPDGS